MTARLLVAASVCLSLALSGCGAGGPQGRAGKWKLADSVVEYTPEKLAGNWSYDNGKRTIAFNKDGTLNWDGTPGKYSYMSDGSLRILLEKPRLASDTYKYTVIEDKLILVGNQDGTVTEFQRAK